MLFCFFKPFPMVGKGLNTNSNLYINKTVRPYSSGERNKMHNSQQTKVDDVEAFRAWTISHMKAVDPTNVDRLRVSTRTLELKPCRPINLPHSLKFSVYYTISCCHIVSVRLVV